MSAKNGSVIPTGKPRNVNVVRPVKIIFETTSKAHIERIKASTKIPKDKIKLFGLKI